MRLTQLLTLPDIAAQADHTSWAIDDNGHYYLILHDKDGNSIASAAYDIDQWRAVFVSLCEIANDYAVPQNNSTSH